MLIESDRDSCRVQTTYLDSGCGDGDGDDDVVSEVAAAALDLRRPRCPRSTVSYAAEPVACNRSAFPGSGRSASEV